MFDWTEYLQFFSWLNIRPDCELETRRIYSYISYWANNFILCDQSNSQITIIMLKQQHEGQRSELQLANNIHEWRKKKRNQLRHKAWNSERLREGF